MYKKTFTIELEITLEQMDRLQEAYRFQDEYSGIFDNFDEFLEDKINFRLLRHIVENIELEMDTLKHYRCEQT